MLLHKTELARATLARTGTELDRRERQVLILCDGRRNLNDIVSMLGIDSLGMIQSLISSGYLSQDTTAAPAPSASKGLFGRIADGVRQAAVAPEAPAAPVAPPSAPAPVIVAAPAPVPPRTPQSRRSMAACKMYMIDMLQLQRTPEAASLAVALQTAQDDDERALALVDALTWLRSATKASVCERVAERLKEIVPETYLAGIEAAWQQMIVNDLSATDGSNVVRFGMRA
ncbi:MAG: hypothetical protein JSR70_03935 [Proteobacteria bacterium]|nr:hypothetical protein [Pseudomonadota bacterium]